MGFFKKMFGGAAPDGARLAASPDKTDYIQIALLSEFAPAAPLHSAGTRQRWNRELPHPYAEMITQFVKSGWLQAEGDLYRATTAAEPFVAHYQARVQQEKANAIPRVRKALEAGDTSEALELRRDYEAWHPLGRSNWTGPEPQLSHSALTRRIIYLQHWLLDGLSKETADFLKMYAAEQHMWDATWRLQPNGIPASVQAELANPNLDPVETIFWKASQLSLYVDNQETWLRCKGGDHVRRIEIAGPPAEEVCEECAKFLGKEFLIARSPDLPLRNCTCARGCQLRYEPVLEHMEE